MEANLTRAKSIEEIIVQNVKKQTDDILLKEDEASHQIYLAAFLHLCPWHEKEVTLLIS